MQHAGAKRAGAVQGVTRRVGRRIAGFRHQRDRHVYFHLTAGGQTRAAGQLQHDGPVDGRRAGLGGGRQGQKQQGGEAEHRANVRQNA